MDMDKRKLGDNELEMVSGGTDESEDVTIGKAPVICDRCGVEMFLELKMPSRSIYSCLHCGAKKDV